jgi:uncharacterized protein (DUF488 family)
VEVKPADIWTIGHSTRTIEHFITMLCSFTIEQVIDVRSFPGSRRFPQFNQEALMATLHTNAIDYIHLKDLGGRRTPKPGSPNTGWRNPSFRGFADYMETENFKKGLAQLERIASAKRTAYMCSEALWWRCHRSLISDLLKFKGWTIYHIMEIGKAEKHVFTQPAKIVDGKLLYH